jgi:UDP-N-acetylglucosamine 2-epimerase (non-hydrolysing)
MIAVHCYCPTPGAADNIRSCPEYAGEVYVTGNTALDAVRLVHDRDYVFTDPAVRDFVADPGPKLLVTAHRRENWGPPMTSICRGLLGVLEDNGDVRACFCWHPNPAVREIVGPLLLDQPRVLLIDPPRYDAFVNLMARCDLLITDSGGIQEEISLLRRYALVLRAETERPEAVQAGFAGLVPPDEHALRETVSRVLPRCVAGELPGSGPSPFGDGHAADRVVDGARYFLGLRREPPAELCV